MEILLALLATFDYNEASLSLVITTCEVLVSGNLAREAVIEMADVLKDMAKNCMTRYKFNYPGILHPATDTVDTRQSLSGSASALLVSLTTLSPGLGSTVVSCLISLHSTQNMETSLLVRSVRRVAARFFLKVLPISFTKLLYISNTM